MDGHLYVAMVAALDAEGAPEEGTRPVRYDPPAVI